MYDIQTTALLQGLKDLGQSELMYRIIRILIKQQNQGDLSNEPKTKQPRIQQRND